MIENVFSSRASKVSFFQSDQVLGLIRMDNERKYKYMFPFFHPCGGLERVYPIPHFPELSLILIRFHGHRDSYKRGLLIENALASPHLFDKFFKYLSIHIYKCPRDEVIKRICDEYRHFDVPSNFYNHQNLSKCLFIYLCQESIVLFFLFLYLFFKGALQSFLSDFSTIFIVLAVQIYLATVYCKKYESYTEIHRLALYRYCATSWIFNSIIGIIGYPD